MVRMKIVVNQKLTFTYHDSAAKTALLLDNTALGPSQLKVESATASSDQTSKSVTSATTPTTGQHDEHHISQDDKPRAAVVAEFLAQGYVLGDTAIAKALELDQKHGVSARFTTTLNSYNEKYQATDKARGIDTKLGVTDKAMGGFAALSHYFEAALGTPTGQKVRAYYTAGQKQVLDVHNEARRLADIRKGQQSQQSPSTSGPSAGAASGEKSALSTGTGSHAEKMNLHDAGHGKTACSCEGEGGICACEQGKCACGKGCSKQ